VDASKFGSASLVPIPEAVSFDIVVTELPICRATSTTDTPSLISSDANEWRSSYGRLFGTPKASAAGL
jgi:hypothetical protein